MRRLAHSKNWMEDLAQTNNIGLVMIYDNLFASVPESWRKVGMLQLGKKRVTAAQDSVLFYVTPKASYSEIVKLLEKFILTLPEGVGFELLNHEVEKEG